MESATTTLADSLLDDLDDLSDVDEKHEEEDQTNDQDGGSREDERQAPSFASPPVRGQVPTYDNETQSPLKAPDSLAGDKKAQELTSITSPVKVRRKRLLDDPNLNSHLSSVRAVSDVISGVRSSANGERQKIEEEEHRLIITSNRHLSNLTNELARAHSGLCVAYKPKFPELEELVVDPIQYKNAVRVIWNEMDMTKVNDGLNEILNSNQIITISVAGSTTSGRPLSEDELSEVNKAAEYIDSVLEVHKELTDFVESRMESLAPSVCALVGATIAARLLGLAGGLAELSKIPACNLQVLGQVRQSSASRGGMSSVHAKPHTGILAECDLVKRCPGYDQKKALKVVAAKLALAARVDFVNVESGRARTADSGRKFRAEIEAKFAKWEEPDKARVLKALPNLWDFSWLHVLPNSLLPERKNKKIV